MSELVLDEKAIQSILLNIELLIGEKRKVVDAIKSKYEEMDTYSTIVAAKSLSRLYGGCVDDYGKVGCVVTEISEALMDIRSIRRALRKVSIPVSMDKVIRSTIDYELEQLSDFRSAVLAQKESLDARLRYYHSSQYMQLDKVFGDKC